MPYLKTNLLQISDIVSKRMLMYYQNILKRQSDELVKKVFVAQQKSPRKEDWMELVREDMKKYNIIID